MSNNIHPSIQAVIDAAQFVPSNRAIRARSEFWGQPGIQVPGDIDLASITALAPSNAVKKLLEKEWKTPGFSEWFTSPEWEREESQRLMHLSLQRLGEILQDEDESSTVIQAAKEVREVWTRLNNKQEQKYADADINEMSKEQLEEYIRRNSSVVAAIAGKQK